jgi:hypothetical protein
LCHGTIDEGRVNPGRAHDKQQKILAPLLLAALTL